jgi:excisionase family DNA binding protein
MIVHRPPQLSVGTDGLPVRGCATCAAQDDDRGVVAMEPITVTVRGACEATGLSRAKIYELIADGRLDSVKVDNRRLVRMASIRALVDGSVK